MTLEDALPRRLSTPTFQDDLDHPLHLLVANLFHGLSPVAIHLAGHGQLWPAMADHGLPMPAMPSHGHRQTCSAHKLQLLAHKLQPLARRQIAPPATAPALALPTNFKIDKLATGWTSGRPRRKPCARHVLDTG